jgi:hypothetical protein
MHKKFQIASQNNDYFTIKHELVFHPIRFSEESFLVYLPSLSSSIFYLTGFRTDTIYHNFTIGDVFQIGQRHVKAC